ncbi:MAG: hypothetical protein A2516_08595 [Alphaproteobacteria bacterium RIFOXYD12_FULL_60_8]|nr:MAG: hypothetical protein A2516_08595 [Alphaproteobacteria bacterium RIFOXYD12_FULL_60_8]
MSSESRKLSQSLTASQLVDLLGEPVLEIIGDSTVVVGSVASLGEGAAGALVFCKAKGMKAQGLIRASRASVIIIGEEVEVQAIVGQCFLRTTDPARSYVRLLRTLFPKPLVAGKKFGPGVVIEDGAVIGAGCRIGAGTYIAACVTVGDHCEIGPNCSLGVEGLAVAYEDDGTPLPYPHIGSVLIGDRVRIGANCVVVRGILENTRIGDDTQLGNQVNIGHNCVVGPKCWISTKALLCGSVTLAEGVMIGAAAILNNQIAVGRGANIGLGSVVTKSVLAGQGVFGVPAKPLATMRKFR